MKGQAFNKADDAEIVDMVSDRPGIRCDAISERMRIPCNTITRKIKRLADESRIFRQKESKGIGGGSGYAYNLFTVHYARKHNIPRVYRGVDAEKSTLELQMLWSRLIRGVA